MPKPSRACCNVCLGITTFCSLFSLFSYSVFIQKLQSHSTYTRHAQWYSFFRALRKRGKMQQKLTKIMDCLRVSQHWVCWRYSNYCAANPYCHLKVWVFARCVAARKKNPVCSAVPRGGSKIKVNRIHLPLICPCHVCQKQWQLSWNAQQGYSR